MKALFCIIFCSIAIILPYKLRIIFLKFLSRTLHFPFIIFGKLTSYILKELEIKNPYNDKDLYD